MNNTGATATTGIYSVWSWDKGLYDYYRANEGNRPGYGSEVKWPKSGLSLGALGDDPDRAGHTMPAGAKHVGSGSLAMGEIVSTAQPVSGWSPWLKVFLAFAIPSALLWLTTRLGVEKSHV